MASQDQTYSLCHYYPPLWEEALNATSTTKAAGKESNYDADDHYTPGSSDTEVMPTQEIYPESGDVNLIKLEDDGRGTGKNSNTSSHAIALASLTHQETGVSSNGEVLSIQETSCASSWDNPIKIDNDNQEIGIVPSVAGIASHNPALASPPIKKETIEKSVSPPYQYPVSGKDIFGGKKDRYIWIREGDTSLQTGDLSKKEESFLRHERAQHLGLEKTHSGWVSGEGETPTANPRTHHLNAVYASGFRRSERLAAARVKASYRVNRKYVKR